MRVFLFLFVLLAPPVGAMTPTAPITDKQSCMSHLRHAIRTAEFHSTGDGPSIANSQKGYLADVNDREKADEIIEAYREIGRQYEKIANTLLRLCDSYE